MCEDKHKSQVKRDVANGKKTGRNYGGPWPKTPGRLIGIALIRIYQLTLSSIIGNSCRHQPTCSEYSYEAVARHGLIAGSWLTFFRVGKCNPFGTSGYDPVPETMVWGKKDGSHKDLP